MLQRVVRLIPSRWKTQFHDTIFEDLYYRYIDLKKELRWTESVWFSIPCGEFEFDVVKNGSYTSEDTWPAEAEYPEPVIVDEFCEILTQDDVFYNIGAGFGYYYYVARAAGVPTNQIYCFEADEPTVRILAENIAEDTPRISAFVSDEHSDEEPPSIIIDTFIEEHVAPTVIKIDIQGHEYSAIFGMETTLETHKPTLYVEVHPELMDDGSVDEIIEFLESKAYEVDTVNHRAKDSAWSTPTDDDLAEKSENGVDYFLRGRPDSAFQY